MVSWGWGWLVTLLCAAVLLAGLPLRLGGGGADCCADGCMCRAVLDSCCGAETTGPIVVDPCGCGHGGPGSLLLPKGLAPVPAPTGSELPPPADCGPAELAPEPNLGIWIPAPEPPVPRA